MTMRIRFWGVRGSIASPGPDTATVGGNTSCVEVLCDDTRIIVDAGTGIRKLGTAMMAEPEPRRASLLLSHMHWDHIGGNGFFKNAKVHIHEKDSDILEKGDSEMSNAHYFNGNMRPMKVERKLKEGDEVFGLKVLHTPGHTPGSICLFDSKDNILLSGDTIFADGVGRTDLPGGSEEDIEKSLERLSSLRIDKILPGHGEPVLKSGDKVIKNIMGSVAEEV